MTLFIAEFGQGLAFIGGSRIGVPQAGAGTITQDMTIGSSVSTAILNSGTRLLVLSADTGCRIVIGSSLSTGLPTANAGLRIPAGAPPFTIGVNPFSRITAIST